MNRISVSFLLLIFGMVLGSCQKSQQSESVNYYLYEDPSLEVDAQKAWQFFLDGAFSKQQGQSFNPGFTTSYYWLVVERDSVDEKSAVLEIGTPQINIIEVYQILDNAPVRKYSTGDNQVYKTRPRPSLNFTFPLNDRTAFYLLRIDKAKESLQLTFRTASEEGLQAEATESSLVIGIMTGMIVLMLIFGLYLFAMTGEYVYLFYILYVASGWMYVFANDGYGYKYLWPESPWLADMARPIFSLLTIGLSLHFIEFYTGKAAYKWLRITMRVLAYVSYGLVALAFVPGLNLKSSDAGYFFQALIPVLVGVYIVSLLTTLIQKLRNQNRMALFYVFSVAPIALFSTLQLFYYSGGVDFSGSFLQHYGQGTGYVMEAVILTFGLAYRFNTYRKEKEMLLMSINHQQARYAKAVITTQENERRQLADQLHDVAGSLLSAAKLNLSSVREKNLITNPEAVHKLTSAEGAVTHISQMLRNLSHAISPVMLEKVGFRQSVEKIAAIFNSSGKIKVEVEVVGFESERAQMYEKYSILYGILYELINNIVKHAEATNALVQLIEHDDSVVLMVEDNGKGLGENALSKATHGLQAIESKIHYLEGSIAFDESGEGGLIVIIEIPKNDDKSSTGR